MTFLLQCLAQPGSTILFPPDTPQPEALRSFIFIAARAVVYSAVLFIKTIFQGWNGRSKEGAGGWGVRLKKWRSGALLAGMREEQLDAGVAVSHTLSSR